MGKGVWVKLLILFISMTIAGFVIGYNYSLQVSKTYNNGLGNSYPYINNSTIDTNMGVK